VTIRHYIRSFLLVENLSDSMRGSSFVDKLIRYRIDCMLYNYTALWKQQFHIPKGICMSLYSHLKDIWQAIIIVHSHVTNSTCTASTDTRVYATEQIKLVLCTRKLDSVLELTKLYWGYSQHHLSASLHALCNLYYMCGWM
jgi:hypothetical protein